MSEITRRYGPPTILSLELVQQIAAEVRKGRSVNDAAFLCGVVPVTARNWMTGGRMVAEGNMRHARVPSNPDEQALVLTLYMEVSKAKVHLPGKALEVLRAKVDVKDPAKGSLTAALEILDRLGDGQYDKTQRVESYSVEEKREYVINVNELPNASEIAGILVGIEAEPDEIGFFESGADHVVVPALGSGEAVHPLDAGAETGGVSTTE